MCIRDSVSTVCRKAALACAAWVPPCKAGPHARGFRQEQWHVFRHAPRSLPRWRSRGLRGLLSAGRSVLALASVLVVWHLARDAD
eukprot:4790736-Alexandrium_andersonii.AAC.1